MTLQRFAQGKLGFKQDSIAVEEDLRIRVMDHSEMTLSRTPGDDMNLITGHLFSHSMIREPHDIIGISFYSRNRPVAEVILRSPKVIRRIFPSPRPIKFTPDQLFAFKKMFEQRQNLFKNTGATHAAALISAEGELLAFGEDVGRHNAFDKAIGRALAQGTLDHVAIAMLSSRLAIELAKKASTANIPILCGFSAATSAGVEFAEKNNITLVGRLRNNTLNVYANGWRILTDRV